MTAPITIPRTIDRLKLINHYATHAAKNGCDLDTELPHIANWALEGVDAIKALLAVIEEQRGMIDRLEHELGAARVVLNTKGDHNADQ